MCHPGRPGSPGAVPRRLAGLGALPQGEVERITLVLPHLDARAVAHLVGLLLRELAVCGVAAHVEVDVGARLIGVATIDQLADQIDDLLDVLGGERLHVGTAETQPVGVVAVGLSELRGHLAGRPALVDALAG